MLTEEDFDRWVNSRFSDLSEEFVEANEDKFQEFAWKKFEHFRQNMDDYINNERAEDLIDQRGEPK